MNRITTIDGLEIGIVESVDYIKISKSNCFIPAEQEDAIGVAFNGVPYNLFGSNEIEDADTVLVSQFNGGEYISEQQKAIDDMILTILEG